MIPKFTSWLHQPTTIAGLAGLVATAAGTIAHILTHDTTLALGAASIAGSAVAIAMPDNSAERTSIERLVSDSVTAVVTKHIASAVPLLATDALAALQAANSLATTTTAVAVASTTPAVAAPPTTPEPRKDRP